VATVLADQKAIIRLTSAL